MVILFFAVLIPFVYFKAKVDILDIGLAFIVIYSIYLMGIPLKVALGFSETNPMFYLTNVNILVYKMVFYSGVCAIVPFIFGYELPISKKAILGEKHEKNTEASKFIIRFFSNALIIFGAALFFYGIYKMGGIDYLIHMYIWNADNKLGLGLLTTGYQYFSVGILIEFYIFLNSIKEKQQKLNIFKWKYLYIMLFVVIVKFYQGNRLPVLMFMMSMFILYNYVYKKMKTRTILLFLLLGVVLLGYVGLFRTSKRLIPGSFSEILNFVFVKSMNYETYFNSYTVLTTLYISTVFKSRYLYGLTFLDGIIYFIPRFIFGGKEDLLFTTKWIKDYNSITSVSPIGGLNLGAQNIMNGSVIFTIIIMFLLGIGLRYLNEIKSKSKYGILLYVMSFPIVTISLVRNPNFLVFKEFVTFALIPYLVIVLAQKDIMERVYKNIKSYFEKVIK